MLVLVAPTRCPMQITDDLISETALAHLGHEAVQLLRDGAYAALASRFGYTLACGRTPALAIREDLDDCLHQLRAERLPPDAGFIREVQYFRPNQEGLYAMVSCVVPTCRTGSVRLELVAILEGRRTRIILEQISAMQ